MINSRWLLLSVSVIAILVLSTVFVAIPITPRASAQAQLSREERNWEYLNYNLEGTNFNPQNKLNKDNVNLLEMKWIFPYPTTQESSRFLPGVVQLEGVSGPPLVVDGIIYSITNNQRVIAQDAKNGKTLWTYQVEVDAAKALKEQQIFRLRSHAHGINYIDGKIWVNTMPCRVLGLDALTGKVIVSIENLCKDIPTNAGTYKGGGYGSHPPVIDKKRGILIWGVGGDNEGVTGGRTFAAGIDVNTGKVLWRTFIQPPQGKVFPEDKTKWHEWLVNNCKKGWIQGFSVCDIPREALLTDWGEMRSHVGISDFWGHWPLDEETGIVYMGSAQPGPEWNHTYIPGPNLISSAVVAFDTATGEIKWYHQTTTHDLWDFDCSWNIILAKIGNRKVVYKGCKNGAVYAMDALTGEALWVFDSAPQCVYPTKNAKGAYPSALKVTYGNAVKKYPWNCFLDPLDPESYKVRWMRDPLTDPFFTSIPGTGSMESDKALAYGNLYFATLNQPSWGRITPVDRAEQGAGRAGVANPPFVPQHNSTVWAIDATTGEVKWRYFIPGVAHRGGTIVSGGLVYVQSLDAHLYVFDARTGELVLKRNFGTLLSVQGSVGMDADGNVKKFVIIGGKSAGGSGNVMPAALITLGLPDKLPQPQVITKEVIKEVIKEVPKEVVKEVTKTVTVETISPISYGAIGAAVVILVIAGVLFTRRKKA